MKIKTVTCHDVYNYGASLQAFALQHFLEKAGHDVQIIDYKPDYIGFHYKYNSFVHPASGFKRYTDKSKIIHFLYCFGRYVWYFFSLRRKWAFEEFTKEYLHLTKTYKSFEEVEKSLDDTNTYIVGSDQVWNSTTMLNGLDPVFYLQFVPKQKRKISYAASFGANMWNKEKHQQITEWLKYLDAISVREAVGVELLRKENIESVHVCDPVFLLPVEEWCSILNIVSKEEKYVLVYNLTAINEKLLFDAIKTAKKKRLKLYSVSPMKIHQADRCFKSVSPQKFVELIFGAEYVFTNSFHATAFSLISNRQFFTYNYHSKSNSSRMESILRDMGLLSRFNIESIEDALHNPIDYSIVNKKIDTIRRNGQDWLISNI